MNSHKHVATAHVSSSRFGIDADLCGMHSRQAVRRLTSFEQIVDYAVEQRDLDTEPAGPCTLCKVSEVTGLPLAIAPLEHAPRA